MAPWLWGAVAVRQGAKRAPAGPLGGDGPHGRGPPQGNWVCCPARGAATRAGQPVGSSGRPPPCLAVSFH